MEKRRVVVTMEIETEAPLKAMTKTRLSLYIDDGNGAVTCTKPRIIQVQVNTIKPTPKGKK
jgi:hypothetical protein